MPCLPPQPSPEVPSVAARRCHRDSLKVVALSRGCLPLYRVLGIRKSSIQFLRITEPGKPGKYSGCPVPRDRLQAVGRWESKPRSKRDPIRKGVTKTRPLRGKKRIMALSVRHQLRALATRANVRNYAAISSSSPPTNPNTVGPYQVFDRNAKIMQRDRAAARDGGEKSRTVDYVRDEIAERMMERFMVRDVLCWKRRSRHLPTMYSQLRILNALSIRSWIWVQDPVIFPNYLSVIR